jgi:peptidoglycan/LPS O-acetylase OafA/YrhL
MELPIAFCVELHRKGMEARMLSTILIVILILALIGALPTWGYSGNWGYGPGGIVGVILVVVVILALLGRI